MALRKPGSSQEFIGTAFDDWLAGKYIEQLRPDVTAETLCFDSGKHGGHVEFFRDLGEKRGVVDDRRTVRAGHAEGHLWLLVNKHDGGICRRVEFVVLVHCIFLSMVCLLLVN